MSSIRCLVVAKAPVPGHAKTRLAATVGAEAAARLAAAALLDTMAACTDAFGSARCVLSLDGELAHGVEATAINAAARHWTIVAQRGQGLGSRLANAHLDAGPEPVLQLGMDTPQVTADLLLRLADLLDRHEAVLGPADDGGWWCLGVRDVRSAHVLAGVPMSTPATGAATVAALESTGVRVAVAETLRDVDTAADARAVASQCPSSRFARAWLDLGGAAR